MLLDPVSKELVLTCCGKNVSLQHSSYFVVISYSGEIHFFDMLIL